MVFTDLIYNIDVKIPFRIITVDRGFKVSLIAVINNSETDIPDAFIMGANEPVSEKEKYTAASQNQGCPFVLIYCNIYEWGGFGHSANILSGVNILVC